MHTQPIKVLTFAAVILLLLGATASAVPAVKDRKAKVVPASHSRSSSEKKLPGKKAKLSKHKPAQPRGQAAPTSQRIGEIQSALGNQGSYQGTPSGRWDDATIDAMKQFQSTHGLNPSGKLDALTLHKLGLGSVTAGQGAPVRDTGPTARLSSAQNNPFDK